MISKRVDSIGCGGIRAQAQSFLHEDRVQPTPMFPAAGAELAGVGKTQGAVQADGGMVGRVADHGHHLTRPQSLGLPQELGQECPPQAPALSRHARVQIDGIFQRVSVSQAGAKGLGVGKPQHLFAFAQHQVRHALARHAVPAASHFGLIGRVDFKAAAAAAHMVGIDEGDLVNVLGLGRAEDHGHKWFTIVGFRRVAGRVAKRVSQTLKESFHPKDIPMVVIRLARGGAKARPCFNIVVADKRDRRDGRFIERIGFYNPIAAEGEESIRIAQDRLTHWRSVGAQASPTVERLIKQAAKKAA